MRKNSDLPHLDPEGRFRRIAEMRHKCRMAAIETEGNAKIRKSLIGRSRPMRGNYVPGDLVYCWPAGNGVHQAQSQWLGPARVIGLKEEMFGYLIVRQLSSCKETAAYGITRRVRNARDADENWRRRS